MCVSRRTESYSSRIYHLQKINYWLNFIVITVGTGRVAERYLESNRNILIQVQRTYTMYLPYYIHVSHSCCKDFIEKITLSLKQNFFFNIGNIFICWWFWNSIFRILHNYLHQKENEQTLIILSSLTNKLGFESVGRGFRSLDVEVNFILKNHWKCQYVLHHIYNRTFFASCVLLTYKPSRQTVQSLEESVNWKQ